MGLTIGLAIGRQLAYGMMGAAIATFASYTFQSLFRVIVSSWLYPVPYEYGRLLRLAVIIAGLYCTGVLMPWGSVWTSVAGKTGLIVAFPLCLYISGFFEAGELARVKGLIGDIKQRSGFRLLANEVVEK